ncbi:MAG: FAD-binding protein, partial [Burkholderiales bacterium]|nr:FAD-binding protein [Burkholderiales bacterium]
MTQQTVRPVQFARGEERSRLALGERLRREVDGEILFDAGARARYSTDASIYQVIPIGVVVPRSAEAAIAAMQIAVGEGVPILPRGAGTSQCGQTVGEALVIDDSKYLNRTLEVDREAGVALVEPGKVLDTLNAELKSLGLWYPIDVSTSAQATLGGMAGNNSCGSRSLVYGNMVDRVIAIDAWLPDGTRGRFDAQAPTDPRIVEISRKAAALWEREREEIAARAPKVARNVAGYNLSRLAPGASGAGPNLASLLVGSEGTLAWFERVLVRLAEVPRHKALGVAHFPRFYDAMDAAQHIVKLGPSAVELVDRTMLDLALSNPAFAPTIRRFVKGEPNAVLLVEFAGAERDPQREGVRRLAELMGDLGFPEAVVPIAEAADQKALWDVRKAGLNIMMSMKGDGKPVSFIEDCAVPLEHLAEYTSHLTEVFRKHGTEGTWYAHASVGCLHVRPVLNMKGDGAIRMRAIAEEAADLVRRYKGAYSGEHGDGLVRSEWIAPFFGPRLTAALGEVKSWFDPKGVMNPGKIVNPPKQDDRSLLRYGTQYRQPAPATMLDWSPWNGLSGAVEMCNNNGHCRKFDAGTMCPSYRATGNERDVTRGRANTLRLALSRQLGPDDVAEEAVREALDLCVSCKGCKRECPTGVDMARMKIEFLAHYKRRHGHTRRDRLIGHLPRYARWVARLQPLLGFAQMLPGSGALIEAFTGFDRRRPLPRWNRAWLSSTEAAGAGHEWGERKRIVLFADTFNNWFEPANLTAALRVLNATGHTVRIEGWSGGRPLCCGRTYLATGMLTEARAEATRTMTALAPYLDAGVPIVGLEPSCMFTFRDEYAALFPGNELAGRLARAQLVDEYLAAEIREGRLEPQW